MIKFITIIILLIFISCSSSIEEQNKTKLSNTIDKIDSTNIHKTNIKRPKTNTESKPTSAQCLGTTKKGQRCARMVNGGSYCYQHK